MIFVWRGWAGALGAFALIISGVFGMGVLGVNVLDNPALGAGLGLLVGGPLVFALGWWANNLQPVQKLTTWRNQRRAQLQQFVDQGTFHLGAGHQPPRSREEAQAQAGHVLAQEEAQGRANLFGFHHFFFIPIQWWGVIGVGLGALLLVVGLTSRA